LGPGTLQQLAPILIMIFMAPPIPLAIYFVPHAYGQSRLPGGGRQRIDLSQYIHGMPHRGEAGHDLVS